MKLAAICIATYGRPDGLRKLLRALLEQEVPAGWVRDIRVVNNDATLDSCSFESFVYQISPEIRVRTEPRRNIAHARNTAIAMAPADAFVFIDDDELPTAGWLSSLLQRLGDADAVFGPVAGRPAASTAAWLIRSGAFDKPGPDHDGSIDWRSTRTSSTAVRGEWLDESAHLFDPEYGTSGGSDTELFRRLERDGARFVHERQALVYEDIEPDRCTGRAVLLRRYRAGAVFGRMERRRGWFYRWSRAAVRTSAASARMLCSVPGILLGRPEHFFNALCSLVIAIGAWRGHNSAYRVTRYPGSGPRGAARGLAARRVPCASPC